LKEMGKRKPEPCGRSGDGCFYVFEVGDCFRNLDQTETKKVWVL